MQLKAIDVAIGMAFLYLLLTFVTSAIVELVSNVRNWRSQILYAAMGKMLSGNSTLNVGALYGHSLVQSLATNSSGHTWMDLLEHGGWRPPAKCQSPVAYIPAAVFSAVVLESIRRSGPKRASLSPDDEVKAIVQWLDKEASPHRSKTADALHTVIENAVATQGYSVQAVKLAIEKWFNDTMDRTSGWYKRRTRSLLLVIGLVASLVGNIDSIAVAKWLWQGDTARQAVVFAVADYVKTHPTLPVQPGSAASDSNVQPNMLASIKQIAEVDNKVIELGYPIGVERLVEKFSGKGGFDGFWFLQYLLGCFISAVAISMGSPFWFDAMQNLLKMRSSGPKPGTR